MTYSKTEELVKKIEAARNVLLAKTWRHYKSGIYSITDISIDCTTGEAMAIYHRIGGPDFDSLNEAHINYSRLVSEFNDIVETDNGLVRRFTAVRPVQQIEYVEVTNARK